METLKSYDEDLKNESESSMKWETHAGEEWNEGETNGMLVFSCNSCGGEIVGDENMAAISCPYCGNSVVVKGQFTGALRPDYVIPFKLNKEVAKEGLNKYLSGKKLVPKIFKEQNHIDEIKGIYVPFWLFNADVNGKMRYRGTKVRAWSDNRYNYIETSFFSISRGGTIKFEQVPVDGSSKMPDDLMESIEPYNFEDAVDFQTAYLAGYLADKYDVTAEQSLSRANQRVKYSTEQAFEQTVSGYNTLTPESSSINLSNGKAKYALYPVWILNTTWQGKNYLFAMNGQTGKFVGDLPVDKSAAIKLTVGLTALFAGITYAMAWLAWLFGIL
jgi:DNA-directed RNA polymerase subunit RPC12/RpoP